MAIRLDKFLTKTNSQYSRNKIASFIKAGCVKVNGNVITEPAFNVDEKDKIALEVKQEFNYVSRAAIKLLTGLKHFDINLKDKVCLDIGCSTGGFSQVMLQSGARFVYAVDVGTDQFDKTLKNTYSSTLKLMEQTNFCHMQPNQFDQKIDFIACDVSFISSTKILDRINFLFNYPLEIILLIKPQFELTKEILDKCQGSVPDKYHKQAINSVIRHANKLHWLASEVIASPILGAKGYNREFIVYLRKQ